MSKTKLELEVHHKEYFDCLSEMRSLLRQGMYREALHSAVSSWEFIDGMMQYQRKYEKAEFDSIETIDAVLRYAPLLFDYERLNSLDELLSATKRIERNTSVKLSDRLAQARMAMWTAHRLWKHLERQPGCRQDHLRRDLGGDQDEWRSIAESWENMGLITRTPDRGSYRLYILTCTDNRVGVKCPSCGISAKAPKYKVLDERACPKCQQSVLFVIVSEEFAGNV